MGPTISLNKEENVSSHNLPKKSFKKTKKETVFILDWDDTLMCTTFVQRKIRGLSDEELKIVNNLGKVVDIFLKECSKYGKIIIMTNSSKDWVKKTIQNYLNLRHDEFNNVKIISTRDIYLKKDINKKKWKEMALEELFAKYGDKIENLICASDSEQDIDLFKDIKKRKKEINISTIKFKSKPSPLVMIKEIEYLNKYLSEIIGTNKNYYLIKEKQKVDDFNFSFGYLLDYIFPN